MAHTVPPALKFMLPHLVHPEYAVLGTIEPFLRQPALSLASLQQWGGDQQTADAGERRQPL